VRRPAAGRNARLTTSPRAPARSGSASSATACSPARPSP